MTFVELLRDISRTVYKALNRVPEATHNMASGVSLLVEVSHGETLVES